MLFTQPTIANRLLAALRPEHFAEVSQREEHVVRIAKQYPG